MTIPLPTTSNPNHGGAAFTAHFGGPDRRPGVLRNLLLARTEAVPPGGEILWVTYYFLDQALADALLAARRRGVRVRVLLEGRPRTAAANQGALRLLADRDDNHGGLRQVRHRFPDNLQLRCGRLHEKLYYFSHPRPHVLTGSFNPSGDAVHDPAVLKEIGDQDRGHNVLVEVGDPGLVSGLYRHAERLAQIVHGPWERFTAAANRPLTAADGTRVFFLPRRRLAPLFAFLAAPVTARQLRIAVSHFNHPGLCRRLLALADQGTAIDILTHDTTRRVPDWVERRLSGHANINFRRYRHPGALPMHNKFILCESAAGRSVAFGSLNFSRRSLHANHELLLITEDQALFQAFAERWETMWNDPCSQTTPPRRPHQKT